jgi:hypothetical protein
MRVIQALVSRAVDQLNAGLEPDTGIKHLWFPENNANHYELRSGNPPPRKQRPRYLRDIDLVVDVYAPPESILVELRKRGIDLSITKSIGMAKEASRVVVA